MPGANEEQVETPERSPAPAPQNPYANLPAPEIMARLTDLSGRILNQIEKVRGFAEAHDKFRAQAVRKLEDYEAKLVARRKGLDERRKKTREHFFLASGLDSQK